MLPPPLLLTSYRVPIDPLTIITSHMSNMVLHVMWGVAVGIVCGIILDRVLEVGDRSVSPLLPHEQKRSDGGSTNLLYRSVQTLTGAHYDVQLFYYTANLQGEASMPNITFVAHVTVDRVPHVRRWCRDWRGPMSISVFVRPFIDNTKDVMQEFVGDWCIARHANLHLVKESDHADAVSIYDRHRTHDVAIKGFRAAKDMHVYYPSNVQRNAALDGALGDMVLLMDIDFYLVPTSSAAHTSGGEERLRAHFETQRKLVSGWDFLAVDGDDDAPRWVADASLYVVPAIETVTADLPIPDSIEALSEAVRKHQACEFYGHYCRHCHHPTNLKKFLAHSSSPSLNEATTPTHVPYLIDYEERFEPYVILNRSVVTRAGFPLPRYNESFLGRFGDKFSFFYEMHVQQRPFVVMTDYFLVHRGRGNDVAWPNIPSPEYRSRERFSERLFSDFKTLMSEKYKQLNSVHRGEADHHVVANGKRTVKLESATTTLRDQEGATTMCEDSLLLLATSNIDWDVVASGGHPNWMDQTSTAPFACIATHRELLDENVNLSDPHVLEHVTALQRAVSWACSRMDCAPLQVPNGKEVLYDVARSYPRNLVAHADWVFGRWALSAPQRGALVTEACQFGGAALLVAVESVIPQRISDHEIPTVELGGSKVVGCTLNPDALVNQAILNALIQEICADPPVVEDSQERDDAEIIMGKERAAYDDAATQGLIVDRIGGDCRYLFQRIHPLVQTDLRVRASVALHAHHLIYFAGGRGSPTCRRRFGYIASYWELRRG